MKNALFTFKDFMQAVSRYPKLCGEKSSTNTNTDEDVCKLELATMLAHMTQETGAHSKWDNDNDCKYFRQTFSAVYEHGCKDDPSSCNSYNGKCDDAYWGKVYPCANDKYYFGRGPFQLSWNYNYGAFSNMVTGNVSTYLDNPDMVATDGTVSMLSAFFFYMSPSNGYPSMHEVVTGFYKPNKVDIDNGNTLGFGTTINIINGGIECRGTTDNSKALSRLAYLKSWMTEFGIGDNTWATENTSCKNMHSFKSDGWAASRKIYYKKNDDNKCELSTQSWSIYPIWLADAKSKCESSQ